MEYGIVWILNIMVQPIKISIECVGIIMEIQVPLLIIDRRDVSIMSTESQTRNITHLTFNITIVAMGY
jgi:hypothetical protein